MEEKRITKTEFDAALTAVIEKLENDERLDEFATFLVPLIGSMFALEMRDILFPEESKG